MAYHSVKDILALFDTNIDLKILSLGELQAGKLGISHAQATTCKSSFKRLVEQLSTANNGYLSSENVKLLKIKYAAHLMTLSTNSPPKDYINQAALRPALSALDATDQKISIMDHFNENIDSAIVDFSKTENQGKPGISPAQAATCKNALAALVTKLPLEAGQVTPNVIKSLEKEYGKILEVLVTNSKKTNAKTQGIPYILQGADLIARGAFENMKQAFMIKAKNSPPPAAIPTAALEVPPVKQADHNTLFNRHDTDFNGYNAHDITALIKAQGLGCEFPKLALYLSKTLSVDIGVGVNKINNMLVAMGPIASQIDSLTPQQVTSYQPTPKPKPLLLLSQNAFDVDFQESIIKVADIIRITDAIQAGKIVSTWNLLQVAAANPRQNSKEIINILLENLPKVELDNITLATSAVRAAITEGNTGALDAFHEKKLVSAEHLNYLKHPAIRTGMDPKLVDKVDAWFDKNSLPSSKPGQP